MIEQVIRSAGRKYTIDNGPPAACLSESYSGERPSLSIELSHFRQQCLVRGRYKSGTFVSPSRAAAILNRCRVHCRCGRVMRREIGPRRRKIGRRSILTTKTPRGARRRPQVS
jgi:hypothetical protein